MTKTPHLADALRRIEELRKGLDEVYELAGWHTDDDAEPNNTSPEDMVAHTNGLIRQICAAALKPNLKA